MLKVKTYWGEIPNNDFVKSRVSANYKHFLVYEERLKHSQISDCVSYRIFSGKIIFSQKHFHIEKELWLLPKYAQKNNTFLGVVWEYVCWTPSFELK